MSTGQPKLSEPPPYSLRRERLGLFLIAAFFLVPVLAYGAAINAIIGARVMVDPPRKIDIREGQGFIEISKALEGAGVVRRAAYFRVYVTLRGWAGSLRPGTYLFSGALSIPEVARLVVSGPGDLEVTIPEGFTVFDIDRKISESGLAEPGEIAALAQSPDLFQFGFLRSDEVKTLEGFLFPDTYRFNQKMTAEAIVARFLQNFERKVISAIGAEVSAAPSLYSVITLASLIEKEVADPADRRIVSGVLWRRLELNIPLQVDASIVYAWKQINPNWKPKRFALDASELKVNSPYNIYRSRGLPPGPIANPGLDAILAALNPAESDYWYYLSAPDGRTIFSRTLEEHNAAKAEHLR